MSHGETHWACDERLKKEGGKTRCCECVPHKDCKGLPDPAHKVDTELEEIIGPAGFLRRIDTALDAPYKGNMNALMRDQLIAWKNKAVLAALDKVKDTVETGWYDPVKYPDLRALVKEIRTTIDQVKKEYE